MFALFYKFLGLWRTFSGQLFSIFWRFSQIREDYWRLFPRVLPLFGILWTFIFRYLLGFLTVMLAILPDSYEESEIGHCSFCWLNLTGFHFSGRICGNDYDTHCVEIGVTKQNISSDGDGIEWANVGKYIGTLSLSSRLLMTLIWSLIRTADLHYPPIPATFGILTDLFNGEMAPVNAIARVRVTLNWLLAMSLLYSYFSWLRDIVRSRRATSIAV